MRCKGKNKSGRRCEKKSPNEYCFLHIPSVIVYNPKNKTCEEGDGLEAGYEEVEGPKWTKIVKFMKRYRSLMDKPKEYEFANGGHACTLYLNLYKIYKGLKIVDKIPKEIGNRRTNVIDNYIYDFVESIDVCLKKNLYVEVIRVVKSEDNIGGRCLRYEDEENGWVQFKFPKSLKDLVTTRFFEKYELGWDEEEEKLSGTIDPKIFEVYELSSYLFSRLKNNMERDGYTVFGLEKIPW